MSFIFVEKWFHKILVNILSRKWGNGKNKIRDDIKKTDIEIRTLYRDFT